MTPSIETIDKLPQPLPHDRVNQAAPSNEEQDREAFKRTLKRKMAGGRESEEGDPDDALIVDVDLTKQEPSSDPDDPEGNQTEKQQAQEQKADAGDREESPAPPPHIDLKA